MQNVPKIVVNRMKATKAAVNHPDADVLTAFAERSLPEVERAIVLEHLARCGDCRDVMILAAPETVAVETAADPLPRRWIAWPTVRWAFVAAGTVAIISLGMVQYQHRQTAQMATKHSVALQASQTEAQNQATPLPSTPAAGAANSTSPETVANTLTEAPVRGGVPRLQAREKAPELKASKAAPGNLGPMAKGFTAGPKVSEQWQQKSFSAGLPARTAQPTAPIAGQQADASSSLNLRSAPAQETVAISGAEVALNTQSQDLEARVEDKPVAPPPATDEVVGKAKPAVKEAGGVAPLQAMVSSTPQEMYGGQKDGASGRNINPLAPTDSSTTFRWTVDPNGGLERSVDRGNTWQGVDVNGGASAGARGQQLAAKSAPSKKESAENKKMPAAMPVFRSVAAMGDEVWAGGSAGALYHSSDGGNHWMRVIPSNGDAVLSGDVVALEFADAQHGKVTTSTPEVWITSDAGRTWQKQ